MFIYVWIIINKHDYVHITIINRQEEKKSGMYLLHNTVELPIYTVHVHVIIHVHVIVHVHV